MLTEEQLGRLDTLTREAIDERLKVLEAVSGTLWRCVGELTKLRSALPVEAAIEVRDSTDKTHGGADGTAEAESTTIEKGKAVDTSTVIVEPAGPSVEIEEESGPSRQREHSYGLD